MGKEDFIANIKRRMELNQIDIERRKTRTAAVQEIRGQIEVLDAESALQILPEMIAGDEIRLIDENKDIGVVVYPEFSFYADPVETAKSPLVFSPAGEIVAGDENFRQAIDALAETAQEKQIWVVAASVAEKVDLDSHTSAFFNTTILISPTGEKIRRRKAHDIWLKTDDEQPISVTDEDFRWWLERGETFASVEPEIMQKLSDLTLETIDSTFEQAGHKCGVLVCSESFHQCFYDFLDKNIDTLVITMKEGGKIKPEDVGEFTKDSAANIIYSLRQAGCHMVKEIMVVNANQGVFKVKIENDSIVLAPNLR